MRRAARSPDNDNIVYIVGREGLDLMQRPGATEKQLDFVWVSPDSVETESPVTYKHKGVNTKGGNFKSDLLEAPEFEASAQNKLIIDALLSFNEYFVVAVRNIMPVGTTALILRRSDDPRGALVA